MTFSEKVKSELVQIENKKQCCAAAQAYGMLLFGKNFHRQAIDLHTINKMVADYYADLLVSLTGAIVTITEMAKEQTGEKTLYVVEIEDEADRRRVLEFFGQLCVGLNRRLLKNDCCKHAFLRGCFLTGASITDPAKEYHLEFVVPDLILMREFQKLLVELGFHVGQTTRKSSNLIYMKESENIEDALTFMGAVKSSLELMDVKIFKDVRNKVNRVTNCETANIEKTIVASSAQIEAIEWILSHKGIEYLSEDLQLVAKLRIDNPELSLSELCQISNIGISRSGMNHRLKKILKIAEELRENSV